MELTGRDDAPRAALPVGEVRRHDQPPHLPHTHAHHALLPALDHTPRTQGELEGLTAVHAAGEGA